MALSFSLFVLALFMCSSALPPSPDETQGDDREGNEFVVAALYQSASMETEGLSTVVFQDGTAYVYRRADNQSGVAKFVACRLSLDERKQLGNIFQSADFFSLPAKTEQRGTDGTTVWAALANNQKVHRVYAYLIDQHAISILSGQLEAVVQRNLRTSADVQKFSASELLARMAERGKQLDKEAERQLVRIWLDVVARDLLSTRLVEPAVAKRFYVPGDGAAINRD